MSASNMPCRTAASMISGAVNPHATCMMRSGVTGFAANDAFDWLCIHARRAKKSP
jgi:hypothetical protein